MESFFNSGLLYSIILGIAAFLLIRFVKGIDDNTTALNKLTATVEKFGEKLLSHETRIAHLDTELEKVRNRIHEFSAIVQRILFKVEK